jgi:uncharacterized protein YgiM (DUF1202 family)
LNLREDADLDAGVAATLLNGDAATILDGPVTADGYSWYQVETDAGTGWVVEGFLGSAIFATGDAATVDTDALNLRDAASLDGGVVAVLETGATVSVLDGRAEVDGYVWYEVEADAGTGWVAGSFLSPASDPIVGAELVVVTDVLNLRDGAGLDAEIVATLVTGDAVTVVGGPESADGYTWYQVETGAGTGWVAGAFLAAA